VDEAEVHVGQLEQEQDSSHARKVESYPR
jgi:hypothetical protein